MADQERVADALERRREGPVEPVAEALETMPYGLYIIGSRGSGGDRNGMMADWVMQVAFKPRLLAVSFENDATTLRFVRETGVFTVNVLPEDARELARHFAQPRDASKVKGRSDEERAKVYDKLAGIDYSLGEHTDCPVLDEALAYMECEAEQFVEAGDHTLVIGRVLDGDVLRQGEPLTQRILGWSYGG
jgi:flavin reductase (DIM6/NTAB) family NADH-FMN oxidoreductase RutF